MDEWEVRKKVLGKEVALLLKKIKGIKFGEFELTSGGTSPYYVDLRIVPSYPKVFKEIGLIMSTLLEHEMEVDRIAAVPTAGMPLGSAITLNTDIPMCYVRDEAKGHGRMKAIEGVLKEGEEVVIVDDLTTTGGSLIDAAEKVRNAGGEVEHALILLNREEGAVENLKQEGIELHRITNVTDTIEFLRKNELLSRKKYKAVKKYLREH